MHGNIYSFIQFLKWNWHLIVKRPFLFFPTSDYTQQIINLLKLASHMQSRHLEKRYKRQQSIILTAVLFWMQRFGSSENRERFNWISSSVSKNCRFYCTGIHIICLVNYRKFAVIYLKNMKFFQTIQSSFHLLGIQPRSTGGHFNRAISRTSLILILNILSCISTAVFSLYEASDFSELSDSFFTFSTMAASTSLLIIVILFANSILKLIVNFERYIHSRKFNCMNMRFTWCIHLLDN